MDAGAPQILEFGNFVLDVGRRSLSMRGGRTLPLRPLVFETLHYLIRHRGVVLSKEEIMRGVWGHAFVEENNLNQHISTLRRLLGDSRGEPRYIATLPRRGYCFIADVDSEPATLAETLVQTIAVLPFQSLSSTKRETVLEMGMADAVIMRLSSLSDTIVRPLAAVRRYANSSEDPRQIGGELAVDAVLSGSIERADRQIRVAVQLLHCSTGKQLWADRFDEPWIDVFAVQDKISQRVAAAITPHLSAATRSALTHRPTENLDAYELYLRGRYHGCKVSPEGIKQALDFYRQAVELDPNFVLAHVGLADIWRMLPIARDVPPRDVFPRAKQAISQALRIDPQCVEAHTVSGFIGLWYDWNWDESERALQTAISLNPGHPEARLGYAHLLSHLSRHDEALQQIQHARMLDPLSLRINALEGMFLLYAGRLNEAHARLRRALELEPEFWVANIQLAKVQIALRQFAAAQKSLAVADTASGGNSEVHSLLVYALGAAGNLSDGAHTLRELEHRAMERYVPPYNLAIANLGLGRTDAAFECLDRAKLDRDVRLSSMNVEPKWDAVRDDPRFIQLVRDLRLA